MCLIIIAYQTHPKYKAIIAFNRDELHKRPTLPLNFWDETPSILGGRDLIGKGSWFAISSNGRIGFITNYRDFNIPQKTNAPSRGLLVSNFLKSENSTQHYLETIKRNGADYNGFNLVVGDLNQISYYSNLENEVKKIPAGIHAISNHLLNTPWPKVVDSKKMLKEVISNDSFKVEDIFSILANQEIKPDSLLPQTGLTLELERKVSSNFILDKTYGTRSSSIVLIDYNNKVDFHERTFDSKANVTHNKHKTIVLD